MLLSWTFDGECHLKIIFFIITIIIIITFTTVFIPTSLSSSSSRSSSRSRSWSLLSHLRTSEEAKQSLLETLCSVEITRLSRDEVRDLMMMMLMMMMMMVVEMVMVECNDGDGNDDCKITRCSLSSLLPYKNCHHIFYLNLQVKVPPRWRSLMGERFTSIFFVVSEEEKL